MNFDKIAIIGGDKRALFAGSELLKSGYEVYLSGFDKLISFGGLKIVSIDTALESCSVVLLPLNCAEGKIPCPFSDSDIALEKAFTQRLKDKLIFGGRGCEGLEIFNILEDEAFARQNALPTAEGAALVAMENYEGTIAGADILVIGYGRIGRALSKLLRAMGARVSVSTRSEEKAFEITLGGNTPVDTLSLRTLCGYDIVFNTADSLVLDKNILVNSGSDTLLIDLASYPGGIDFETARELGFTAVHALALPGRYSPQSAGKAISDAVLRKLKEEFSWQRQA